MQREQPVTGLDGLYAPFYNLLPATTTPTGTFPSCKTFHHTICRCCVVSHYLNSIPLWDI